MSLAKLDYLCDAPKGLPSSLFPISLGSVRSDVHDLSLDYHADTKRLHVLITLAQGVNPGDANPGAPFDDLIIGIVDHASFELVFPIESPRLVAYNDPSGGVTIFAEPATVRISCDGFFVPDAKQLEAKLRVLVPASNLLQEYNTAAQIENSVQQFVALWGVLTYVVGTATVAAVEKYFHGLGISDEPLPGPHGPETKYARVRGEIAHPADRKVALSQLPSHVAAVLPEFRKVVRQAVAAHLGLP